MIDRAIIDTDLRKRLAALELLVLDVDGVMTDGKFALDHKGRETKTFNTQDGFGIRRLLDAGIVVAIITGRSSGAVTHRANELGIGHVVQGARDKAQAIRELLEANGVEATNAAAMGDDVPDLDMFQTVAVPIAVANAVDDVKDAAALVTQKHGGEGAIREIADLILDCRDEAITS
ncbi:MAG: HAD hydrolase family protein [Pseudomonadota bacterium]